MKTHLKGATSPRAVHAKGRIRGFSLVEILVVLAVIGLITAATAPTLFATMKANRLSAAGEDIVNKISLAQQMAVSRNREIELRFYHYQDPEDATSKDHYRAVIVAQPVADQSGLGGAQAAEILSELTRLRSGIVVVNDEILSPIFSESGMTDSEDRERVISSGNASFRSIRFFPDGSNDLTLVTNRAYLTLADERDFEKAGSLPKNFYAVQIDHYTSRTAAYRP